MKKTTLLAVVLLFFCSIVNAQFKSVAEGPVFEEPEQGFAKLLQMKDGSTVFLHVTEKKGINVRIYNATHKEIAVNTVQPSYGKLKGGIEAVFEIAGNVVLMVSEVESRTPMLYRIVIDGKTGAIKDDQKIAELPRMGLFDGYAMVFGNVPMPDFFVRKDPDSDNYAVVMFNSFVSERSKRIEIITYGSNNQETKRAFYASPQEHYKYLRYVDMVVIGPDKVSVLAYAYNTRNSGGKESELIMANLDKGQKDVSFTELGFSKDLMVYWGITRYSPAAQSVVLLALAKQKSSDSGYAPIMAFVNPFDRKLNRADVISPSDKVDAMTKKGFKGLPQNMFINPDGSITVVSEELSVYTDRSGSSTTLGDLAVVNYSKTGEFVNDYYIRKSQEMDRTYLNPLYQSMRESTGQALKNGNQFKSFAYLHTGKSAYILFNDTKRNDDAQEKGGLVTIKGVSASDGYYYPIKGTSVIPPRSMVFPAGERKSDHNLGLFAISDYDVKNNLYVTLKLEINGDKGVKVVWLKPE